MRTMMWMIFMIIFLCEVWTQRTGTNESSTVKPSSTSNSPRAYVFRNEAFNLGSDVNLTCSTKTWKDVVYVIWTLKLKYRECKISFSNGETVDRCKDGKSIQNTSDAQSYLHIKNFSVDDVGLYQCEFVYKGGNEDYKIQVAITVPPEMTAWLEHKDDKMVAVCKAERGNPAANISWSHTGNSKPLETQQLSSDGFFTVESRLELPEDMDTKNLSCLVRHPYWNEEKIVIPHHTAGQISEASNAHLPWLYASIAVITIMCLAAILLFAQKKLKRKYQQDISPSKSPQTEDVEEVEPYASYVQRVNSIYNTSADMFT